jgi:hypothetical protein
MVDRVSRDMIVGGERSSMGKIKSSESDREGTSQASLFMSGMSLEQNF